MHSVLLPSFELPEDRGGIGKVIGALARAYQHMLCVERVPRAFSYTWLVRLFLRHQPKEIWTHHVLPIGTVACMWNILTRTPYVVFLHGQDFDLTKASWRKRCVTKVILRRARLVVANSQALAREIAVYYHLPQVDVLYPTVDPLYLASVPDKVRTNRLRLLTVCRLVSRKGILRVLDALRDLPDVDYTIIGRGVQEYEINEYIRKHHLESRVTLRTDIDTTEELRDAYDHADVFVMPTQITSTDREGFGIVYLEAAARGLPVIASNLAGVDEAVVGGETGILISDGSREQLIQSIRALQESPDRARALGDNGRSRMLAFFSPERFVAQAKAILTPKISVIIPTYNHAEALPSCLDAIFRQYYQYLEVIIVNDGSTDNTLLLAQKCLADYTGAFQIISNKENIGKKKSITSAIETCNSELIICRDADTYTEGNLWLKTIVSFYEESKSQFIIAPLQIENKNGFINQLQFSENAALSILTGGFAFYKQAFLCNGANLAFSKKIFEKVGGFKSHININSGDDVLFLEDVKKINPEIVSYLKNINASVTTYPLKTYKKLLEQKVRWASKFDKNPNQINAFLGIIVLLVHLSGLFYLIKPLFAHHIPVFGIIFVFLRVFIDFLLLFLASRYYNKPIKWLWILPLSFLYSFYVIVTALLSSVTKPKQKKSV